MIRLFESTATEFRTLGLGNLSDAISCSVSEERNGAFELVLEYPIDGIHYSDIALRNLIVCKSNPFSNPQAFRIYYISKPINGIVTINAEHISYDLSGMVVSKFTANTAPTALAGLKENSTPTCNFNFSSNKEGEAKFEVKYPMTLRSLLGGTEGSILDVFGTGEYTFDNFNVSFKTHRGEDRNVTLRYGKNLTDLTQEENCSKVYTAVYPYWAGTKYENETTTDVLITLPEKIVNVEGTFNYSKIYPLDTGTYFSEPPSEEELRQKAKDYISQNGIGKPEVSLKVSFLQLEQAEEYEQLRLLESVYLCDTVTVLFPELGVDSKAKCVKTEYNVLTDRYTSLEFGDSRTNLANTIVSQAGAIAEAPTASFMDREIKRATDMITKDGLGGYVVLHNSGIRDAEGKTPIAPDELLILDENSGGVISKSQNVWRFNKAGLGFSSNGYAGDFDKIAITMDGKILADQVLANGIQAGTITAEITMISPTIQNKETDPTFKVDKDGVIRGAQILTSAIGPKTYKGTYESTTSMHLQSPDGTKLDFGSGSQFTHACNIRCAKGPSADEGFGVISNSNNTDGVFMHQHDIRLYIGGQGHNVKFLTEDTSDRRLKKNIKNIDSKKIKLLFDKLAPKQFKYKKRLNKDGQYYGLIAQDVLQIFDELNMDSSSIVNEDKAGYYSINYTEFIGLLIMEVKDLQSQIDKLREEINKNES